METRGHHQRLPRLSFGGLCGLGLMNAVLAAPPEHRLDLRAPAFSSIETGSVHTFTFPNQRRPSVDTQEEQLSRFSAELAPTGKGGLREMARRFHEEGVPFARLWENKSALVSLGLSQRGKPGLWIIQKTH